jgi:gamma-butyrobetaine dioxygenase
MTRWQTWKDSDHPQVSSETSNQVFKLTDKGVLMGTKVPIEDSMSGIRLSQEVSFTWLRDHCRCESCVQSSTSQKLHRTGDIWREAHKVENLQLRTGQDGMENLTLTINDHLVRIPTEMLSRTKVLESGQLFRQSYWKAADLAKSPLRIAYSDLSTPSTLHSATQQLIAYGIVVISGVPTEKTDDKDCSLRDVMKNWGEIRNTFYGETWDVKSLKESKNIAYTDVDLGLHMDLWCVIILNRQTRTRD